VFVTITDIFQLKYIGLKCSRVFCVLVYTVIDLMFCVFRAVYKFDFRLAVKATSGKEVIQ
jgi:hypothetical protein